LLFKVVFIILHFFPTIIRHFFGRILLSRSDLNETNLGAFPALAVCHHRAHYAPYFSAKVTNELGLLLARESQKETIFKILEGSDLVALIFCGIRELLNSPQ
jgi:hypothetical protein